MTHDIKIWPEWFNMVIRRHKEFELRKAERPYAAGDTLRMKEFDPKTNTFTGRVGIARIQCVMSDMPGLLPGFVAMGILFLKMESQH